MSQGRPKLAAPVGRDKLAKALAESDVEALVVAEKFTPPVHGVDLVPAADGSIPIAAKLNLRQRVFCEIIVRTMDPRQAKSLAGYAETTKLTEILNAPMEAYIEELLRIKMEAEGITDEHVTTRINDIYFAAIKGGTPQHLKVALECMKELARHRGMIREEGDGGNRNQFNFMFGTPPVTG